MNLRHFSSSAARDKNLRGSIAVIALLVLLLLPCGIAAGSGAKSYFVYAGTFTSTASKGIYGFRFSPSTGAVVPLGLLAETANPSWLVATPNQRFLYSTNEHPGKTQPGNTITAYAIDRKSGKLTFLNRVSAKGVGPCHLALDRTGKILIAANFGSGSIVTFRIPSDGRLGEPSGFMQDHGSSIDPVRQGGPHAHGTVTSPDNRFVMVADLGADRIFAYRLNHSTGVLEPNDTPAAILPPGRAPRHMAFHPNGKFMYMVSDKGLTTFAYDAARGRLKELQTLALPEGSSGQSTYSEVQVDRAGRFVYDANRKDASIGVFAVDPGTGTLTTIQRIPTGGETPRSFSLDPAGAYLISANEGSDSVTVFRVDSATGRVTPAGQAPNDVPDPACVVFVTAK
ncbi:MAG: lactonase family protein [Candidatus Acidiferrales bacterium]|jgi:6-phosphogluconolactonase